MRVFLTVLVLISSLQAQTRTQRPKVLGLAHVAYQASDLGKSSAFYSALGYELPFSLKDANGNITTAFVKIDDKQYLELFQGDSQTQGQLDHFALYTDDLAAMQSYLTGAGVTILKEIHRGRIGNDFLTIRDPDGHHLEIVQYSTNSSTGRAQGKFMPAGRVSDHMTHVGIVVSSVGSALKFYRDVLGFRESSRGGGNREPGWVDLQTADGTDYVELIPFAGVASAADLKSQNHVGLRVPDVRKAASKLQSNGISSLMSGPISILTGAGLPARANIFSPDGARIEIMEAQAGASSPTLPSP